MLARIRTITFLGLTLLAITYSLSINRPPEEPDVYLTDEQVQQKILDDPDWDEPFALTDEKQSVGAHLLAKEGFDTNASLTKYLYRDVMRQKLQQIPDKRVKVVGPGEYKRVLKNLEKRTEGVILFVIDYPFASWCNSVKIDEKTLDNPKLLAVATENWAGPKHPKVTMLPIGFSSGLMTGKKGSTVNTFMDLVLHPVANDQRKYNVQSDAQMHVFSAPKSHYRDDRGDMEKEVPRSAIDDWYVKHIDMISHFQNHVSQANFALCPEGNGMDTHRFYHNYALHTRCIVRRGPLAELQSQFPGTVVVNSWKDVTAQNIEKWSKETFTYNPDLVTSNYWINKVLNKFSIHV